MNDEEKQCALTILDQQESREACSLSALHERITSAADSIKSTLILNEIFRIMAKTQAALFEEVLQIIDECNREGVRIFLTGHRGLTFPYFLGLTLTEPSLSKAETLKIESSGPISLDFSLLEQHIPLFDNLLYARYKPRVLPLVGNAEQDWRDSLVSSSSIGIPTAADWDYIENQDWSKVSFLKEGEFFLVSFYGAKDESFPTLKNVREKVPLPDSLRAHQYLKNILLPTEWFCRTIEQELSILMNSLQVSLHEADLIRTKYRRKEGVKNLLAEFPEHSDLLRWLIEDGVGCYYESAFRESAARREYFFYGKNDS